MKLDFKFSNLCGTVYKQGNVLFTPDGNSIVSPVGNRVTVFDLVNNKSVTLPFENRKNIARMALSPNGSLLITVDEDGRALLVNFQRHIVLHHHTFKEPVRDIQFSPNGRYLAVTFGRLVQVWKTPGFTFEFSPFVLHRTYGGHYDDVTRISWSADSLYFVSGGKDMIVRIHSLDPTEGFEPCSLASHRDVIVGAWFSQSQDAVFSVDRGGALIEWRRQPTDQSNQDSDSDDGNVGDRKRVKAAKGQGHKAAPKPETKWKIANKRYFDMKAKVVGVAFHAASNLLVAGFSTGIFGIWELPDFNNIHTLSISQKKIDTVAINATGEWLAFGASKLGQLLVWEWQSESYVLKQQGHQYDMNCLAYSQDGQYVVTGGDDGKVKLWNVQTGFCFVTFTEHTASVNSVEFAKQGQVIFSASLDGTIRAFDLVRYRNFRTFTSPTPVQFGCLTVDPSGEIVCGGSIDTFEIYVWSVQTGKLLDIYSGHKGPISCMTFSPTDGILATGSWDKTVRVWDVFGRDISPESYDHQSEVLAVAYRPDGKEVAATTLDGQISFWEVENAKLKYTIEGRKDISGGRKTADRTTAANSSSGKSFTSVCYTSDGQGIIAGGNSKYVCIYDISSKILLKRFQISSNLSLDGMHEKLNSKNMTEAGPRDLIDTTADLSDPEDRLAQTLPGAKRGDLSLRTVRPEARTKCVRFSPTGRSWAAASTEGLLVYSLDDQLIFDPFDLEIDITATTVLEALAMQDYLRSLVMAFRLGEAKIVRQVYETIPPSDVLLVSRNLPSKYLGKFVKFLVGHMEENPRIEFHLSWIVALLKYHGRFLKEHSNEFSSALRGMQKVISKESEDLSKVCNDNTYTLQYLTTKAIQAGDENLAPLESMELDEVGMDDIGL
ncbi:quinon protein alcohol dehydrogenase-like superfamily [Polychytrium aggregatum]|uniref:quinon protein alcohol dehydrogenase-like superfamily n=1 Tax=Polychytrium aggregatum TaxID=110093 RepID=UPI0022FE0D0B|nr:quinon protein alcohol dehydrogenase-like superfamily [Polychytrium aggregatum]KAI9208513.1 quinon protein alcohol dehydrogenase-like superfamily [Polychytrium aggregatum]